MQIPFYQRSKSVKKCYRQDTSYSYRKNFVLDPSAGARNGNVVLDDAGIPLIRKFYEAQIVILEALFGVDWFEERLTRRETHPAVERWKLCKKHLSKNCTFKFPDDEFILPDLLKVVLDNVCFIECTRGDLESFSLGSLANYGDSRIQKRIKNEIYDPRKYFDIQTELQLAARHLSHGHNVSALPDGPDHLITIPSWKLPIASECKRLDKDTKISRVSSVIKKANKQIKTLDMPCHGIVVIDVSEKIVSNALSDEFPLELAGIRKEVTKALYNYNRSVSAALLFWKSINIMKSIEEESGHIFFLLQTYSSIIKHRNPLSPLGEDMSSLKFGNNINFSITLHKSR